MGDESGLIGGRMDSPRIGGRGITVGGIRLRAISWSEVEKGFQSTDFAKPGARRGWCERAAGIKIGSIHPQNKRGQRNIDWALLHRISIRIGGER